MSKFLNSKIIIPSDINLAFSDSILKLSHNSNLIKINIPSKIILKIEDNQISILSAKESYSTESCGTYFRLIQNACKDIKNTYKINLILSGVGFKVNLQNQTFLSLSLGFSHKIFIKVPSTIKVEIQNELNFSLSGISRQEVSSFAKFLMKLRKKDSYKGKGIHFINEIQTLKPGKRK